MKQYWIYCNRTYKWILYTLYPNGLLEMKSKDETEYWGTNVKSAEVLK